jgi:hypothetical protein
MRRVASWSFPEAVGNFHHEGHEEHEAQIIRQFRLFPASDYVNLRVLRIFVVEANKVALQIKTMFVASC